LLAAAAALSAEGQKVPLPATISGRLPVADSVATFRFDATKGQRWRFKLESRSLGFPLDALIELRDASGAVIAENDDANNQRDALLAWTAPADGEFRVSVRDIYRHGGARYAFRLTVEPIAADYGLAVASDSFAVVAGKTVGLSEEDVRELLKKSDAFLRAQGFLLHRLAGLKSASFRLPGVEAEITSDVTQAMWAEAVYVRDFRALDRLAPEALVWALERGSRSGRIAYQFARDHVGRQKIQA